jgi:hypothetical protein
VEQDVDIGLHDDEHDHAERRQPRHQPQHDQHGQEKFGVGSRRHDQPPREYGHGGGVVACRLDHGRDDLEIGGVVDGEEAEQPVAHLRQRRIPVIAEQHRGEDQPREQAEKPALQRTLQRAPDGVVQVEQKAHGETP